MSKLGAPRDFIYTNNRYTVDNFMRMISHLEPLGFIVVWNKIYRASIAKQVRFTDNMLGSDDDLFNCQLLPLCTSVCTSAIQTYCWDIRPTSTSAKFHGLDWFPVMKQLSNARYAIIRHCQQNATTPITLDAQRNRLECDIQINFATRMLQIFYALYRSSENNKYQWLKKIIHRATQEQGQGWHQYTPGAIGKAVKTLVPAPILLHPFLKTLILTESLLKKLRTK